MEELECISGKKQKTQLHRYCFPNKQPRCGSSRAGWAVPWPQGLWAGVSAYSAGLLLPVYQMAAAAPGIISLWNDVQRQELKVGSRVGGTVSELSAWTSFPFREQNLSQKYTSPADFLFVLATRVCYESTHSSVLLVEFRSLWLQEKLTVFLLAVKWRLFSASRNHYSPGSWPLTLSSKPEEVEGICIKLNLSALLG